MDGPAVPGGGPHEGPLGEGTDPEMGARFTGFSRKIDFADLKVTAMPRFPPADG